MVSVTMSPPYIGGLYCLFLRQVDLMGGGDITQLFEELNYKIVMEFWY